MSVWNLYINRIEVDGKSKRERALNRTKKSINQKALDSLSSKKVLINGCRQDATILSIKGSPNTKRICAMPNESLPHGGIVDFADNKWLISEVDADSEVYASGEMKQCNHLLKWLNREGKIIKRWCVVEDGTKYLIGERSEKIITVGDARITITIGKDKDTNELNRGMRFLIDDLDSQSVLAYQITKPNKLYSVYNGEGVFRFILNEVNMTDDDNLELRIADYYNWSPDRTFNNNHKDKDKTLEEIVDDAMAQTDLDEKDVWL